MNLKAIFFLSLSFFIITLNGHAKIIGKLLVNGSEKHVMQVSQATNLEVFMVDDTTGETLTEYRRMHMKYMHFVIMKNDLTVFKHIHPYLDAQSGKFMMPINLPNGDFDNQDAKKAITEPGEYHVYAEVDFKDIGMRKFHWILTAEGPGENVFRERQLDLNIGHNKIFKYFADDGISSTYGAKYEGVLTYHTIQGCGGNFLTFKLDIKEFDPQFGYKAIDSFTPWLMMGGHVILLNTAKAGEKRPSVFAHLHSKMPNLENPSFEFTHFDRNIMNKDKYSFWVQFGHRGKILSIPFVFAYTPPEAIELACN